MSIPNFNQNRKKLQLFFFQSQLLRRYITNIFNKKPQIDKTYHVLSIVHTSYHCIFIQYYA